MGQLISGPVTFKDTKLWRNSQFYVAASSMQGWRVRMEDAYTCILNLPPPESAPSVSTTAPQSTAYFAVFDGHGGTKISEYAASHLHTKILAQNAYAQGDLVEAMRQGVLQLDAEMQSKFTSTPSTSDRPSPTTPSTDYPVKPDPESPAGAKSPPAAATTTDIGGGSTCIAVLLRGSRVCCANCGDSRAVLSRRGVAQALSADHKPTLAPEWSRIVAAGGWVAAGRVNGNLALSRALGDFAYKRNSSLAPTDQIVSPQPDVTQWELNLAGGDDEFIVMGCDGIWDVMTNQEVVSFVRSRLGNGITPDVICEELMMHCLAPSCNPNGLGCDNMTVVIVCLLNGGPVENLKERCSRACPAGAAPDVLSP